MPARARFFLRSALFLLLFGGVALMLWPLGQSAFGWWNQRALQAQWVAEAQSKTATPKVAFASPRAVSSKSSAKTPPPKTQKPKAAAPSISPWPATRIVITEIGVDAVVLQGMDLGTLRRGPGHDPRSSLPGQSGNCVIAAHRNVFGAWFADLDRLWAGSLIELRTPEKTFTYEVLNTSEISETDTSILESDPSDASPRLTLITCTLPTGLYRHVVTAQLVP